jgi:hypothetical protein
MDMRRLVGQNVSRIRKKKGLTQERFAEISGFSQQYLRRPTVPGFDVTALDPHKALRSPG